MDTIVIYPTIRLETMKWDYGNRIPNPNLIDNFHFSDSYIFTFSYLKANKTILSAKQYKVVEDTSKQLIDTRGEIIQDFTIVFTKNVGEDWLDSPETDGEKILSYLFYKNGLDYWSDLEFIKIEYYESGGRSIVQNNGNNHWVDKYRYLLTAEDQALPLLYVRKSHEIKLLSVIDKLKKDDLTFYNRLLSSISLFNQSCRINKISESSSIVLMVSAFESLFEMPRNAKKDTFSFAMKLFWAYEDRIQTWASELYELRSLIVHGEIIKTEKLFASIDHHYPHFKITREIFQDSILMILERKMLIEFKEGYRSHVQKKLMNLVISNKTKVEQLLREKKKYTYENFKNDKEIYKDFLDKISSLTMHDNSADKEIIGLIKIIFVVMEEWITIDLKEIEKSGRIDEWPKKLREYYKQITDTISAMDLKNKSISEKFHLNEQIESIINIAIKIEPIFHYENQITFTFSEYVERSLRPITYVI